MSTFNTDDCLFSSAYGLFSSENYEYWSWFLQQSKMAISEMEVIIISDRHQGIIRSVSEVFKFEYHAYCYRHVKENFNSSLTKSNTQRRNGKENASEIIKNVAYAWLNVQYVVALEKLHTFNPNLAKWVEDNNPKYWVLSKFPKIR